MERRGQVGPGPATVAAHKRPAYHGRPDCGCSALDSLRCAPHQPKLSSVAPDSTPPIRAMVASAAPVAARTSPATPLGLARGRRPLLCPRSCPRPAILPLARRCDHRLRMYLGVRNAPGGHHELRSRDGRWERKIATSTATNATAASTRSASLQAAGSGPALTST